MLSNPDWKWFIIGVIFAVFIFPFIQAKLGAAIASRKAVSKNTA